MGTIERVRSLNCCRSGLDDLEVADMAGTTEYKNKWQQENKERINLVVNKGQKETIKAHAEARGESLNAFINRAIAETMERDGAAAEEAAE